MGQVKVRVMPSTFWISDTTSLPRSSSVSASVLHDHVVGTGHVVGVDDAGDGTGCRGDLLRPPDLGLDQHVRGDAHVATPMLRRPDRDGRPIARRVVRRSAEAGFERVELLDELARAGGRRSPSKYSRMPGSSALPLRRRRPRARRRRRRRARRARRGRGRRRVGTTPMAVSAPAGVAVEPAADPLEHARVLAEAGPQELAVVVLAEPVHAVDRGQRRLVGALGHAQPVGEVVAHVVAAERAASRTGRGAARRARRWRRRSSPSPWWRRRARRAASSATRTRAARWWRGGRRRGTPRSARPSGPPTRARSTGTATPATQKREFGCAAGRRRTRASTTGRFQSVRCAGGSSVDVLPPHVAVVGERGVGEHGVARRACASRSGWTRSLVPGATPKNPNSGLIACRRPSSPNFIHAMSSPMVSTFQPGIGRDEHGEVGLAARRRERGGDVVHAALGARDLEDEHVLGEPALVARDHRRDAQREALLAEQRVAAVARAERPDLARLGEVHDPLLVGVARPRRRRPRRRRAARRPSARRARSRRRGRARRARPGRRGSSCACSPRRTASR